LQATGNCQWSSESETACAQQNIDFSGFHWLNCKQPLWTGLVPLLFDNFISNIMEEMKSDLDETLIDGMLCVISIKNKQIKMQLCGSTVFDIYVTSQCIKLSGSCVVPPCCK
jgi:hypothetical protein